VTPTLSFGTDIHCHVLPGMDEGSRDTAESLAMLRVLAKLGVRRVHATPHQYRFGKEWRASDVVAQVDTLRDDARRDGLAIEIVPSAEHLYGERLLTAMERGDELLTWPVPASPAERGILIELPLRDPVIGVERVGASLRKRGLRPVLAHPERVEAAMGALDRSRSWQAAGWELQLDLLALVGTYGRGAERSARAHLDAGLYSWVGSDLHRSSQLPALERAHLEFVRHVSGAPDGGAAEALRAEPKGRR
jgi:tyrosine-protein phosphatase YwqE